MRTRAAIVAVMVVVAAASVFLGAPAATAGGGCHRGYSEGQTQGAGSTVEMKMNCFGPTVLRVAPGTEVTFINRDSIVHRLDGVGWGVGDDIQPAASATQRFAEAGTYPYGCNLHPGMIGTVVVGDGAGSGAVEEITPVTELASAAESAAPDVGNDDANSWAGAIIALGIFATLGAFAAGRATATRPSS